MNRLQLYFCLEQIDKWISSESQRQVCK